MPSQHCFQGNGTGYRGVANTTTSGLSCLPWNSDLLYQELHVDSVATAALLGLGPHAYCRSAAADGWKLPRGGLGSGSPGRTLRSGTPIASALSSCLSTRNPDRDERPWCYVVKDSLLSWEYCRLPACIGARKDVAGIAVTQSPLGTHCPGL